MVTLIDIIFQSGTFEGNDGFSISSFLSNLFISVISAVIATFTALHLYKKQVKENENAENTKRTIFTEQKLRFFSSILNSIIEISQSQTAHFIALHNGILNNAVEIPLPAIIPSEEIKRFIDSPNSEDYFHSYCNKFGNSLSEIQLIEEFRKCIVNIDFLYVQTNLTVEMVTNSRKLDFERKQKHKNIVEKALEESKRIANYAIQEKTETPYTQFLNTTIKDFDIKAKMLKDEERTTTFFHNCFITPLLIGIRNSHYEHEEQRDFSMPLGTADLLYKEMILQNLFIADDVKEIIQLRITAIKEIIPIANRLNTAFQKKLVELKDFEINEKERVAIIEKTGKPIS